jgi:hypothetical protein
MNQHALSIEPQTSNRQVELMRQARQSASFNPRQLTYVLYDGYVFRHLLGTLVTLFSPSHSAESVERREAIISRVEAKLGESDSMVLPRAYGDLGRTSQYHEGLRFGKILMQMR